MAETIEALGLAPISLHRTSCWSVGSPAMGTYRGRILEARVSDRQDCKYDKNNAQQKKNNANKGKRTVFIVLVGPMTE